MSTARRVEQSNPRALIKATGSSVDVQRSIIKRLNINDHLCNYTDSKTGGKKSLAAQDLYVWSW